MTTDKNIDIIAARKNLRAARRYLANAANNTGDPNCPEYGKIRNYVNEISDMLRWLKKLETR